ncbi:unnamed protein product [Lymnaea stagnalis]|uniref:Sema domain-containing protein n=1 Tax=Lymnaea stagnalis TaxID=6523 RepID=A0AAV2IK43_LYMST
MKGKVGCDNFIRVLVRKSSERVYICGTNSFQPRCRHYEITDNGHFKMVKKEESEGGTGVCPFDPKHNSTAIFTDGKLYSATVADADARDPLILQKTNENVLVRTQPRDSIFLNEPNFVSSFEKDDKVFFFFRETAVENINCGKTVFSRVARVCKQDKGGAVRSFQNTFTSFFKARLNCSIPGEFPFYFNEIQSTTHFGQGNYRPTKDSGDRSDMIYAVFSSPENGLGGSAVCAYKYSEVLEVFRGRFKGQESFYHNWLPVPWEDTPTPHPEQCMNSSQDMSFKTSNFIKSHPLMDDTVQPKGSMPMLVFPSFRSKLTQIAVDWQVLAADKRYYDVMFVGTDDGRVIKAINKGEGSKIESVVIEDIQVLEPGDAVVSLKVLSDRAEQEQQKLVVVSKKSLVSIPLHRCSKAKSCSSCVGLQDPYCAWNQEMKQCLSAETGLQSIITGKHGSCKEIDAVNEVTPTPEPLPVLTKCTCPPSPGIEDFKENPGTGNEPDKATETPPKEPTSDEIKCPIDEEGQIGAAQQTVQAGGTALEIVITAVIVSIIVSLVIGFFIGYKFHSCRGGRESDVFYEVSSLQRGRNRLSSGDNPYFHTDPKNMPHPPKQMNYVVNLKSGKGNSGVETKPVTKSNKVYL